MGFGAHCLFTVGQERDPGQLAGLFSPGYGHLQSHQIRPNPHAPTPPQVRFLLEKLGGYHFCVLLILVDIRILDVLAPGSEEITLLKLQFFG